LAAGVTENNLHYNFGKDAASLKMGKPTDVTWDTLKLVNGHTLLVGMSGAGKTHQLKKMISSMQSQSNYTRFHVFDVHGDINITGASEVLFSEQTPYGLNPLRVNPDPHFGGVRKCIGAFLRTVGKASSSPIGVKQEAVIRNILLDVYRHRGFLPDLPSSWRIDEAEEHLVSDGSDNRLYLEVPISEKEDAKAHGARWDAEKRLWWVETGAYNDVVTKWPLKTIGRANPTLNEVIIYAQRLLKKSFMGSDQEAITRLEDFNRAARAYRKKEIEAARRQLKLEDESAIDGLEKAKGKAIESYIRYVEAVRTGVEFDDLIKYDSVDVLKSVVDRLEALRSTGIFKGSPPPFEYEAPVWTYKIQALDRAEKKMFVLFRLQEIFNEAIQRGESSKIHDVLILDEAQLYVDEDGDSILNILSREARKFGVAIVAASQNASLPEDFISSLATKVVLGIDEMYWKQAVSKMRIEEQLLEWIRPHRTLAIQMKEKGSTKTEWRWVVLPDSRTAV
jgi:DNA helicase HerA-like ATPase